MSRHWPLIPVFGFLIACSTPALATTVVVPDNYPTIQAAIDGGADTIAVRDGLAPERLTVTRHVVIEPGPSQQYHPDWAPMPLLQSMEIPSTDGVEVLGCRFLGEVRSTAFESGRTTFVGCRFDSGFAGPTSWNDPDAIVTLRGCMFFGNVSATAGSVQFIGNTVIGGKVSIWSDGNHDIRNNYIQGPADAGLELRLALSVGSVAMNTIRGTSDGIRFVGSNWSFSAFRNDIADCSGDGIVLQLEGAGSGSISADSNMIARCGGAGIVVRGTSTFGNTIGGMRGNHIDHTGQRGIDLGPGSIAVELRGNVVLDCGGDGITVGLADHCEGNLIGRNNGVGLHILDEPFRVVGNTTFSNVGAGIRIESAYAYDSLFNNVTASNDGPGLVFVGSGGYDHGPPLLGCNDWFQNTGGAVVGMSPGATDLQLNPLFCDLPSADVHLAANSPLLAAAGCGLIGALGQGCVATAAVDVQSAAPITRFRAWPVPARGAVAFDVPASNGATTIEVFDVTGARRWQREIPAGATRLEWDRRVGNEHVAAPGVYFARLRRAGVEVATARIVLAE